MAFTNATIANMERQLKTLTLTTKKLEAVLKKMKCESNSDSDTDSESESLFESEFESGSESDCESDSGSESD